MTSPQLANNQARSCTQFLELAYDGLISALDSPRAIGERRKAGQQ